MKSERCRYQTSHYIERKEWIYNLVGSGVDEVIVIGKEGCDGFKKASSFGFRRYPVVPSEGTLCGRMPFTH